MRSLAATSPPASGSRSLLDGPRAIAAHERAPLIAWLDDALRRGERGRLEAEYPVSMCAERWQSHRAIWSDGAPVAHAMLHGVVVRAHGVSLPLGLIGNVLTAPELRGRGLARRCVDACLAEARARGYALAMLWSDQSALYARLGFQPCGVERRISLLGPALGSAGAQHAEIRVARPVASEFPLLEQLYAEKPVHVARAAGDLERLAGAPNTTLLVARRAGAPIAYAAAGRGDDLQGVVHEWAGEANGALACVSALARQHEASLLLASAAPEEVPERLIRHGAGSTRAPLGLARLLDARKLWRTLHPLGSELSVAQRRKSVEFSAGRIRERLPLIHAFELFFGSVCCEGRAHAALLETPWPLYLWGFDSI
jgi:GNAT superfamily N-acetyltransferase